MSSTRLRSCSCKPTSELAASLHYTHTDWLQKSEERPKKVFSLYLFKVSSSTESNKMGFNYGTEVCQRLGAGAFGVVYKMDNPRGAPFSRKNPIVAVKKIAVSVQLIHLYMNMILYLFVNLQSIAMIKILTILTLYSVIFFILFRIQ